MTDAQTLTEALGGRWYGHYGTAPCPICQPQRKPGQNALTLKDGYSQLLAHCKHLGCTFGKILAAAGVTKGSYTPPDVATVARRKAESQAAAERREEQAWLCWQQARPIHGTVAESYLRGRGITCDLPETLRFHPECWHSGTRRQHPAMVALVEGSNGFAVHRTYLRPDGSGKAEIKSAKRMLGPVAGGAVWLTEGGSTLAVAEGIETALSLSSGLLSEPATVCAALSTSGMSGLCLTSEPRKLIIAPDGDEAGHAAAKLLEKEALDLGWTVSLRPAPIGYDWNDILAMRGGAR